MCELNKFLRAADQRNELDDAHDAYVSLRSRHAEVYVGALSRLTQKRRIDRHRRERRTEALASDPVPRSGSHAVSDDSEWRVKNRQPVRVDDCESPVLASLYRNERVAAVRKSVQRLPEKYKLAIVMRCLEGQSVSEIAEQLGCPPSTVNTRLRRAKEILKQDQRLEEMAR